MRSALHTFIALMAIGTATALGFVACSSNKIGELGAGSTQGTPGPQGAVDLKLSIPGGEHVSTVSYSLANPADTIKGTYNVTATTDLSFVIGSVPAGSGYALSLSATSDDGSVTCAFPAPGDALVGNISVLDGTTTDVSVNMQCTVNQGRDAGSLLLTAVESNCPIWNTIVASPENITVDGGSNVNTSGGVGTTAAYPGTANVPAEIVQGQSLVLVGSATAPNPGALTFSWTANGGTVSSASGTIDPNSTDAGTTNQTIFTCPTTGTGTYTITLTLGDGPLPTGGGCDTAFTTGTVTVTCQAPATCAFGTGCGDGGQICNLAGSCVPALFSVLTLNSIDGGVIDTHTTDLPISIQKYSTMGVPVGSPIPLPTAASGSQQPITIMGSDITEGDLTTSSNGQYLSTLGWGTSPGSTQSGLPVVARIDATGHVDTSTVATQAFQDQGAMDYRSAVSYDGNEFWISGTCEDDNDGNGCGIWYVPFGSTSATQLVSLPNSGVNPNIDVYARWLRIYNQQLFSGADQSPPYMFTIGSPGGPLPTMGPAGGINGGAGLPLTSLPGGFTNPAAAAVDGGPVPLPPSPYGFLMFDLVSPPGPDTIYIADDGINPDGQHSNGVAGTGASNTGSGGLSKWSYNEATGGWQQVWNITGGTFALDGGVFPGKPIGYRGLAGFATGSNVTLMATSGDIAGDPDSIMVVFVDNATSVAPPAPMAKVTSPASQVFRGVALTPQ